MRIVKERVDGWSMGSNYFQMFLITIVKMKIEKENKNGNKSFYMGQEPQQKLKT